MTPELKLALCQTNPRLGDLAGNATLIADAANASASEGAELIVFPELALTGYPPEDLLLNAEFVADSMEAMETLAKQLPEGATCLVGTVWNEGNGLQNVLQVVTDGQLGIRYAKTRLPNYGVFDEARYFTPGSTPTVISVNGVKVGLSICEDIWFAGAPASECVALGAELIVNASASPFHAGKIHERIDVLAARAQEHKVPIAYCALVGGQDELVFDGQSLLIDGEGSVVARAKPFVEDRLSISLGNEQAARLEIEPDLLSEIEGALHLGLADYVGKNGFNGVVLGLSGGIDSAVVATLAVDAIGAENVQAAVMPSPWSSPETQADARLLASNLGIELFEFSIGPLMDAWETTLGESADGPGSALAAENIQARIRGNILMGLSNTHGWLVVTTGNKSELAVGYSTLYGDAAGGFGLLKDVPKGTVYDLARLRNSRSDSPIPMSIIERAPSAELRPGQRDDDSLPPYDRLDEILRLHIEEQTDEKAIAAAGFDGEEVARILTLVDRSEYKRRQYPPGVKITPLAFGRDRRMPMTNLWRSQRER